MMSLCVPPFPRKTLVMGIVNVTPDSFFDGGRLPDAGAARCHAEGLVRDGADILDVGGESTRPGAAPVPPDEELRRVLPAVEALVPLNVPVSVDTYHARTARRALELGAAMVNDITALRGDPEMAAVIAETGCPCVFMHMQGEPRTMQQAPRYEDVVDDIRAFFGERLDFAAAAGIREDQIWLDPGFGFGKTVEQNLLLLRRLREFLGFGRPLLLGVSNKSTLGAVLGADAGDRTEGTAAAVAFAAAAGVHCVRVHDVKTMARVVRMCDAVTRGRRHGNG
jgi:dihydropteroate synthase